MAADKDTIRRRIIFKAIKEPGFVDKLNNTRVDLFSNDEALETVYASLKEYYKDNPSIKPSKDVLSSYVYDKLDRKKVADGERQSFTEAIDAIYDYNEKDQQVFDSQISDYIKREQLLKSIKNLVKDDITDKSISRFEDEYNKIQLNAGDTGLHDFYSVFDEEQADTIGQMIKDVNADQIPISIQVYNEATGGGLGRGELGAIAAKSGSGKSLSMTSLANAYIADGYNVLYIALEELNGQMFRRISNAMLGKIYHEYPEILNNLGKGKDRFLERLTWTNNLAQIITSKVYNKIIKQYEAKKGNRMGELIFTRYSPNTVSVPDLRSIISNVMVAQQKKIDVIFIDYPDLISIDQSQGESFAGGRLYEDLRAITQEFNTVMWVASQMNRSAPNEDGLLTVSSVQGSYRKINVTDFFASINGSSKERTEGFSRLYIDKSRHAPTATNIYQLKVDEFTNNLRDETENEAIAHQALFDDNNREEAEAGFRKNLKGYESDQKPSFRDKVNRRNSL